MQLLSWFPFFGANITSLWTPSSQVSELYWYYTIMVLRFVWDCLVFTQYSYYRDLFCSGTALRLRNCHHHVWVRYIDTTKITFWCMSLLLLSIDLRWFCYFIMFYFKLTNGAMVKWWMTKWCNGEIKIRIGRLVFQKDRIFSFVIFLNTTFSQQTKQSITLPALRLRESHRHCWTCTWFVCDLMYWQLRMKEYQTRVLVLRLRSLWLSADVLGLIPVLS